MTVSVVVHATPELLVQAAAARLVVRLVDAQAERGFATLVLTGGRIANELYAALRTSPARDAVDWSHVDIWWGDDRFLPSGHPDRNETQAREALLSALPLDPARVHPMPAADGSDGNDPEAAAARYVDELAAAARPGTAALPHFDVLLLGVGDDGHIASVFPEYPAAYESRPVAAVRGAPKPPPVRLTLTLPAINTAEDIWVVVAGADKASAVGMALTGAGAVQLPAAGVRGVERTLWLLDRTAAAEVGPRFRSLR
ncbi:MAG TPA: 6-phosphogluconolactonase [Micromonosporaceae bacterium]|nr:6-phosphogluconolactonase [Micromonosporaceae bacterium]